MYKEKGGETAIWFDLEAWHHMYLSQRKFPLLTPASVTDIYIFDF